MKRTPLGRKTPLSSGQKGLQRSTSKPLRATAMKRSAKPSTSKPREPRKGDDVLAAAQAVVRQRAGMRCERCARNLDRERGDVHHRRPRQMGGDPSPETNSPSNLVLLCRTCHEWCESHRAEALATGWLVPRGVAVPAEVRLVPLRGAPFTLTDDGGKRAA